jgi:hypothetical protein
MKRFWNKVRKTDGCWEWTGAKSSYGHGNIKIDGIARGAHRVVLELEGIDVPSGMVVRHNCDNPSCVNPDHLRLGSQGDNVQDMHDRKRHKILRGSRMSLDDAIEIRALVKAGAKQRDLAKDYGVSPQYINSIVKHRKWREIA